VIGLALLAIGLFLPVPVPPRLGLVLLGFAVQNVGIVRAYSAARRAVQPHHAEPSTEREAALEPRRVPMPGGWAGQSGPFLILALAAAWIWLHWDAIPNRFPIHWDLVGHPNGWASKSAGSVFVSPISGAATCLLLALLFKSLAGGVRRIHSSGPEADRESRNLKYILRAMLGMEYGMALMFGYLALTPLLAGQNRTAFSNPLVITLPIAAVLGMVVVLLVVCIRGGQGGWRLGAKTARATPSSGPAPAGDRTPDECWKGGLVYYNRADPALWVEKRFGIGWTLNFGNPRSWMVMGGILFFAAGIAGLSILLVRK